jgi:hypothetical protein
MLTFVRRSLVVLFILTLSLGYGAHSAHALLEQSLLSATRGLFDMPPSWLHGAPRRVHVNGAVVQVSTGRSELSLPALLDHVAAACAAHDGGLAHLVADAERVRRARLPALEGSVLRAENAGEGVVACLDLGTSAHSLADLTGRLTRFSRELDLAELGGVRMVRVQALEHGSFFVVTESVGSVPLARMFPTAQDAPGIDLAHLPRPRESRRLLSAWQEHGEPALAAYISRLSADELWAEYTESLRAQGWHAGSGAALQSSAQHAALFARHGHHALVTVSHTDDGAELVLMPLESGPGAVVVR